MTGTAALVGAVGGAGTTRLAVEVGATLAAEGSDVAVIDAAFATQGLGDYLEGTLAPDATALVTDRADVPLRRGLTDLDADLPGRVACCPAAAPFERVARAKTADAARRLAERIGTAGDDFDAVLVDTPPVAANQAVAAVHACDRTALVAPATARGSDGVERMRARIHDLGGAVDAVVATRGESETADASVPQIEEGRAPEDAPVAPEGGEFGAGVASATEAALGVEVDGPDEGGFLGGRDYL